MVQNYAVINEETNICANVIVWDGQSSYSIDGHIVVLQNSINIGDECEQVNGVWQKKQ